MKTNRNITGPQLSRSGEMSGRNSSSHVQDTRHPLVHNRRARKVTLALRLGVVLLLCPRLSAQTTGIQSRIGPLIFTNSAAFGFADGTIAGTNFYCGLYAGTNITSLHLCSGPGSREAPSADGIVTASVPLGRTAPPGAWVLVQFRVWPSRFASYEEAVASGTPSPPAGVSAVERITSADGTIGSPVEIGPIWLSPAPLGLAADLRWHPAPEYCPTLGFL